MKTPTKIFVLLLILLIALFLRFFQLGEIPAGLHGDAASQGYNAYSLLETGKDRYGQTLPILFRSLGSYQPPIYTYLTIVPVWIFGNSIFSVHFISALSGVILVLLTFLFLYFTFKFERVFILSVIGALILAISPWSVFFSRLAIEANLSVTFFVLSIFIFILSLKKISLFPLACFILGFSTHVYYSERLIAVIFLPLFIILYGKVFLKQKLLIFIGISIFIITQIPHLLIFQSGALEKRFDQVGFINTQLDNVSSTNKISFAVMNIGKTFLNNYLIYYSPKNLFFDSDSSLGRTMPNLSVFYSWLIIPFIFGVRYLIRNKSEDVIKVIFLLLLITPIPAGLTGDIFYPLRTIDFLWVMTIVISLGMYNLNLIINKGQTKILIFGLLLIYSLSSLYISYFILFKYEKAHSYGYAYKKLMDKLPNYADKHIILDSARDMGIGVRLAYLKKYDPIKIQQQLQKQLKSPYYSIHVNTDEIYKIDNIEVKPLDWHEACKKNFIMIGDSLTFSTKNVEDHRLKLEFEIKDLTGESGLVGYSTRSENNCN